MNIDEINHLYNEMEAAWAKAETSTTMDEFIGYEYGKHLDAFCKPVCEAWPEIYARLKRLEVLQKLMPDIPKLELLNFDITPNDIERAHALVLEGKLNPAERAAE